MMFVRAARLLNQARILVQRRCFAEAASSGGGGTSERIKGLVLGVYEGEDNEPIFSKEAEAFNDKLGGKLMDLLKQSKYTFSKGRGKVFNNIDNEFWAVALVGMGKKNMGYNELEAIHEGMEAARTGAALGIRLLQKDKVTQVSVESLGYAEQAAEGATLALWRYQELLSPKKWKVVPTLELYGDTSDSDGFQRGVYKADSQNWARKLCDTPANLMTPLRFAQECVNELCPCGIKVEVHDRDWIEHNKMQAVMAVAKGSCEPPVVLVVYYCGAPEEQKPIIMCGKGITFDSGGVCVKKCKAMDKYRGDLAGAASIVAAMRTVAAMNLPINLTAILPMCENMISGMAMKCGDIVMGMNGKSIMIKDTDNEGRLLLADALCYAQLKMKPRLLIDVGTLTDSHRAALGSGASGVYTNSQTMWAQVRKAGIFTGDRVWRLPLWKYYKKKVTLFRSHDVDNKGVGKGGSPLAAAFLHEFIECVDWIHFDTTGVGLVAEDKVYPYYRKGRMTGRPTRTLVQLLYQLACPEEGARDYTQ